MYKIEEKEEKEGLSLFIENAAKNTGKLEIEGNQEQEIREGYNLLDVLGNKSAGTTQTVNGVTYIINKDGSIKVNGTATDNADYFIAGNWGLTEAIIKLNGTYKLQLVDNNNTAIRIYLLNQSSVIASATNSTSLTKTQDVTGWFIRVNAGQTVNTTIYPQLVEGTEDKVYEQYGASPSPNYPSPVICLGSNKNIYNEETTEMNKYLDGDTGTIGTSTVSKISDYIELKGNEYTINYTNDTNSRGYSFYDKDKTYISGKDKNKAPYTITKPENAKYIRIGFPINSLDIKVEEGTQATSYSPYNQGSTKISKINKNLVYLKEYSRNGVVTTLNVDGSINIKGTATGYGNIAILKENIVLKANKNYTFSIKKIAGNNMSNSIWFWNVTDKNSEITLSLSNTKKTFKYNKDVIISALNITINQGDTFDITLSIQVEEGTEETEHIKHEQTNYNLPIQQEMLTGDYFVKEADGWKEVHAWKKYIFTGDEGFVSMENGVFYSSENLFSDAKLPNSNTIPAEIYCNCLKSESYNKTWEQQTDNSIALNADGTNNPRIYYSKIISATEFKNLLQQKYAEGNPIYAYYKTTTPTKLLCTEEQIAVLEELNDLNLYEGTNNIITTEDIALLKLTYNLMITEEIKEKFIKGPVYGCLKLEDGTIIDESNYLKDFTLEDLRYVPDEGFIGGTVAKKITGNFNNVDSSFNIENKEFDVLLGIEIEEGIRKHIKYGTFIVQKPEDDQVTDNTSFEALDYMIKLNLPWENRMTYPCTLKELFFDLVEQSGLSTKVKTFLNEDFIVENNQFEEGTTRRDVLKAIAQMAFNWARIDEDNNIVMDFEKKDTIDEEVNYDKYYNLTKQNEYGPINVIILKNSQVEGENITIRDEESIEKYGETELIISDNPFAYNQAKRAQLIEAGKKIFGLKYVPITMNMIGQVYLNCLDKIRAINMNNEILDTYLLNHTIEYNGTVLDSMESPAMTKTETKYQFTSDMIKALQRTEILVDKANQKIQSIVEEQTSFSNKITNLTIGLNEINGEINSFYDFTRQVSGINEILLEDAINMDILKFEAKAKTIRGIYPRKDLYPSKTLYPKKGGTTITLVFGRTSRDVVPDPILPSKSLYPSSKLYPRNNGYYKTEFEFYIKEPLRNYLNLNDRFIIELDQEKGVCIAKVIRYIDVNEEGEYIVLSEPKEEIIKELHLQLFEGNNYVYIKEVRDWDISATYVFNNKLNKDYALRIETNSKIKATEDEINLAVSKKVDEDKVISSINLSPEEIKILAKNLQLEGFTSINGNFIIDEEGNMICNNATIKGTTIANGKNFSVDEKGNVICKSATMENVICENFTIKNSTIQEGYIELKSTGGNSSFSVIDTSNERINSELSAMILNFNSNQIRNACMLGIIQNTGAGFISVEGDIDCNVLHQNSLESIKKNIEKFSGGLELVKNSDIYEYNFKTENDGDKKHIGFIIGDKYRTPFEVLGKKGTDIEPYSAISILWNAVQEQQKIIESKL